MQIPVRVASDASHGYSSASGSIAEWTDVWAFVAAQLGVTGTTH